MGRLGQWALFPVLERARLSGAAIDLISRLEGPVRSGVFGLRSARWVLWLAAAASTPALAGWSQQGVISETYTSGGWTMVYIPGAAHNPAACAGTSHYAVNTSAANYRGLLASILAAQLAGRQVVFYVDDTTCGGQSTRYPMIASVKVLN